VASGRFVAFLLVGPLLSLRLLAYASPPDPSTPGGFWDDGDYDNVVMLITSASSTNESAPLDALEPRWEPVQVLVAADDQLVPGPAIPPRQPRGPPLA